MLIVKNWRQFQHYKDRNPPWVKLHFTLLSSADWVALPDASRVLAIVCMLLASRNDGKIDDSPAGLTYLRRVAYLNSKPDLTPLIKCGFLEYASASASTLLANSVPETENLTENKRARTARCEPALNGAFFDFWQAYPKKASKGSAEKAWIKINPDEQLTKRILSAVERAKTSGDWLKEGGQFIPHPATWLNGKRWEDEIIPVQPKGPVW